MGGRHARSDLDDRARPVGLCAVCDLRVDPRDVRDESSQAFAVSEFIALADGVRVLLHSERGFAVGSGSGGPVKDLLTAEHLVRSTLNTVLPDEDFAGEHPWEWLLELAENKGVMLTLAEITELPYEVVLTPRVTAWLEAR